jgi:hypothetical protein
MTSFGTNGLFGVINGKLRNVNTLLTSQVYVYFGLDGLATKIPFI